MQKLATLILIAALSACGSETAPSSQSSAGTSAAAGTADAPGLPAAQKPVEEMPTTLQGIEAAQQQAEATYAEALEEVPPALREKHQAALNCAIAANDKLPWKQQREIGVATVREITARLKSNPEATLCS
ncbi:hypothetical protein [Sphingosinicella sp. BN140058]|uniref:hypothetical protein n=1 Tax=Sphingosinicella sp. BN140058 TaxID=1892855 RepID=UPI001012CD59|nr:hypothetical protein [Sphingosinicella sp. BN140058]QAY80131.1 hypothetical protein ETR14_26170 [Sphingosinicella sp. BN140058]